EYDPNCRPFSVCRSGHAGIQRYAQVWAGDNLTHWDTLKYNIANVKTSRLPCKCTKQAAGFIRQYRTILSADTASEARQLLSQKRR
ncbi:Glycoside hydrolase, family 31, partial [human gut metagenome]